MRRASPDRGVLIMSRRLLSLFPAALLLAVLGLVQLGAFGSGAIPAVAAEPCGLGFIDVSVVEATSGAPVTGASVRLAGTPLASGVLPGSTYRFSGLDTCGGFGGSNEYRVSLEPPAGWTVVGQTTRPVRLTPAGRAVFQLTDGTSVADQGWIDGLWTTDNSPNVTTLTGGQPVRGEAIVWLAPGCPGALAGLQPGDVITAVNGVTIEGFREGVGQRWSSASPVADLRVAPRGGGAERAVRLVMAPDSSACDFADLDKPLSEVGDDPLLLLARAWDGYGSPQAEAALDRLVALRPGLGIAWWERGAQTGNPADLQRGLALDPAQANWISSDCTERLGDDWPAYTACQAAAAAVSPLASNALNNWAWGLVNQDRMLDRALELVDQALALNPLNQDSWDTRGFIWLRLGNRDAAIVDYTQAVTLACADEGNPACTAARDRLRRVLAGSNNPN